MATTTAVNILTHSLKQIRVLGVGDVLQPEDAQDALDMLNLMMEAWSMEKLMIFVEAQSTFNYIVAKQDYTIGPGADFAMTLRPLRLHTAITRSNGLDFPMTVLTDPSQWDHIQNKGITVPYPSWCWYEQTYPLGTIHFFPAPDSTDEVLLRFWEQLQSFPTLTTAVSLPAAYKAFLVFNMAEVLCGEFGIPVPATVTKYAESTMNNLKDYNHKTLVMSSEVAYMNSGMRTNSYNIHRDNY